MYIDVIYPDFPHKHFLTVPDLFYQIAIVLVQVRWKVFLPVVIRGYTHLKKMSANCSSLSFYIFHLHYCLCSDKHDIHITELTKIIDAFTSTCEFSFQPSLFLHLFCTSPPPFLTLTHCLFPGSWMRTAMVAWPSMNSCTPVPWQHWRWSHLGVFDVKLWDLLEIRNVSNDTAQL